MLRFGFLYLINTPVVIPNPRPRRLLQISRERPIMAGFDAPSKVLDDCIAIINKRRSDFLLDLPWNDLIDGNEIPAHVQTMEGKQDLGIDLFRRARTTYTVPYKMEHQGFRQP